jgi:hypothetical protein
MICQLYSSTGLGVYTYCLKSCASTRLQLLFAELSVPNSGIALSPGELCVLGYLLYSSIESQFPDPTLTDQSAGRSLQRVIRHSCLLFGILHRIPSRECEVSYCLFDDPGRTRVGQSYLMAHPKLK